MTLMHVAGQDDYTRAAKRNPAPLRDDDELDRIIVNCSASRGGPKKPCRANPLERGGQRRQQQKRTATKPAEPEPACRRTRFRPERKTQATDRRHAALGHVG